MLVYLIENQTPTSTGGQSKRQCLHARQVNRADLERVLQQRVHRVFSNSGVFFFCIDPSVDGILFVVFCLFSLSVFMHKRVPKMTSCLKYEGVCVARLSAPFFYFQVIEFSLFFFCPLFDLEWSHSRCSRWQEPHRSPARGFQGHSCEGEMVFFI